MEINKNYEPKEIEKKWYDHWLQKGYFTPEIDKNKRPFTILIPPPNVTNILHMGHVLNNTLQDVMIRYKRMTGTPTLWLPGVDHAGIATQNMVEKELAKEGKTRHEIGREELIERIWKWKEEKGSRIIDQLKKLGASCDWSRERFTMDEGLSDAVKEVFIQLYEKDLIYRGKRIINWCPRCVTALSNDEVEHENETGKLWNIKYPVKGGNEYVTVATTRPETMLGDTAVAIHPEDKRYQHLVGKTLILPFLNREIPIITDEYVDREFGSGCVKITPAHDPNDYEIGLRHDLQQIIVIDEHGFMNENAGPEFAGLNRFDAREKIVELLQQQKLLDGTSKHQHAVGQCYRCHTVIEPYLSDQWFVKMAPLAQKAIEVVKQGKIKFHPQRWIKVYLHWMENIRDWCISRQIWWGHRIPVYYCLDCNEIIVAKEQPESCPACKSSRFRQDEDVLDTWFSSWLWPFSTLGWPEDTEDLEYFLPTNLLVTAPDIIYLWVARMIMATLEFKDKIPFDNVLLHGMVRDEIGRKMSKSLGNSPDPLDIIDTVGADALRFSIIFSSPKGQDSYYSNTILESGRNFANKIWNAYRFIMMNVENISGLANADELQLELADKWIYSRLHQVIGAVIKNYEALRFNDVAAQLMDFIWKDFCSWYLELAKERIYSDNDVQGRNTAKFILLDVLQSSMRLLHPIMPFLSEEIWQNIKTVFPMPEETIVLADFPRQNKKLIDLNSIANMELIKESIVALRNLRKQVNLSPAVEIKPHIKLAEESQIKLFKEYQSYFQKQAKVSEMILSVEMKKPESSLAAVVQDIELYLPLKGLIDIDQEKQRLSKQMESLEKEFKVINGKLNDQKFLTKAPQNIVAKEQEKFTEVKTKLEKTRAMVEELG